MYLNVVFKINSTIVSGLWCTFLFSKFSNKVLCIASLFQNDKVYGFIDLGVKTDKLVKNDLRFIVLRWWSILKCPKHAPKSACVIFEN